MWGKARGMPNCTRNGQKITDSRFYGVMNPNFVRMPPLLHAHSPAITEDRDQNMDPASWMPSLTVSFYAAFQGVLPSARPASGLAPSRSLASRSVLLFCYVLDFCSLCFGFWLLVFRLFRLLFGSNNHQCIYGEGTTVSVKLLHFGSAFQLVVLGIL